MVKLAGIVKEHEEVLEFNGIKQLHGSIAKSVKRKVSVVQIVLVHKLILEA